MRLFVVFLLVANVILYFWIQQQSTPARVRAALPAPDVGYLRLLNGIDDEHSAAATRAQTPEPPLVAERPAQMQASPPAAAAQPLGPIPDEPAEVPPADDRLQPLDPERPEPSVAAEAPPAVDMIAPADDTPQWPDPVDNGVVAPAVPGVEEIPPGTGVAVDVPAAPTTPQTESDSASKTAPQTVPVARTTKGTEIAAAPVQPAAMVCARVGPFEASEADQLIGNLPAHLRMVSDVSEEYAAVDAYFVMIPPLPSRTAGVQKLEELAEAGIDDTWLFASGQHRNGISLGLFRRESLARRHAVDLKQRGFETEVKERTVRREGRWLMLQTGAGGDIASSLPLPDSVTVEVRPCP